MSMVIELLSFLVLLPGVLYIVPIAALFLVFNSSNIDQQAVAQMVAKEKPAHVQLYAKRYTLNALPTLSPATMASLTGGQTGEYSGPFTELNVEFATPAPLWPPGSEMDDTIVLMWFDSLNLEFIAHHKLPIFSSFYWATRKGRAPPGGIPV